METTLEKRKFKTYRKSIHIIYVALSSYYLLEIIVFIFYRIWFYCELGQPLEYGNIPQSAPNSFRIVKSLLSRGFFISLLFAIPYLYVIVSKIVTKDFKKKDGILLAIVTLLYFLFLQFDFGATWLLW